MTSQLHLTIPEELARQAEGLTLRSPQERIGTVIRWSRMNVDRGGGPFAAGVFCLKTGDCVSVGVNRVVDCSCSVAHAEMMALMLAQRSLQTHDLKSRGDYVLTSSAQPCSQCYGALPWSGIVKLEFGAGRETVETVGFDEGPVPDTWRQELGRRGIQVEGPLLEDDAAAVLRHYKVQGGPVY
jgi:tRNA(Arg) A34 adenosine deaminase TadA